MIDYQLMQMADSALPTGGFAYSQGLESASVLGLVNPSNLADYLLGVLQQAAGFELPFLNSFFGQDQEAADDYDATFLTPWMHSASLAQGRSLARLWGWKADCTNHYLAVLGHGLRGEGYSLESAQRLFLHMILRDQISAAIRLGLVGPLQAALVQKELYPQAEVLRLRYASAGKEQAARSGPLLDLAQGSHHRLYTRLFQS